MVFQADADLHDLLSQSTAPVVNCLSAVKPSPPETHCQIGVNGGGGPKRLYPELHSDNSSVLFD
jgi:hypothetical protein